MDRSATAELDLEAGRYCVMVKITAARNKYATTPAEVVKDTCEARRDKLLAVGLSYDLAHAKGGLKESEVEHKERIMRERRNKRKTKAKKFFEAERAIAKKDKLRNLRKEAKEKAKEKAKEDADKDKGPQGDATPEVDVAEANKPDESTTEPSKLEESGAGPDGEEVWSQDLSSKEIKIIIEVTDKTSKAKTEEAKEPVEVKQPADSEQLQVATPPEAPKDDDIDDEKKIESAETKDGSATKETVPEERPTTDFTPSTSSDGKSAPEDGSKGEEQPSTDTTEEKKDDVEKGTDADKATDDKTADKPADVEPEAPIPKLTLDTISDDGLSWSSDIDMPPDTPSETESDSDEDDDQPASPPPEPAAAADGNGGGGDQPLAASEDRWNAVCVFGLRVYSKGSQAEIEVVRTQDENKPVGHNRLDVDDQAADATKKLQKGQGDGAPEGEGGELDKLEDAADVVVGTAPAWQEESKQG